MAIRSTVKLGPLSTVSFAGNDDALDAFTVRLEDVATGKVALAFRHVAFLSNACSILFKTTGDLKYETMATQFKFLDECSIHRNARLTDLYKGKDMHGALWSTHAPREGTKFDIGEAEMLGKADALGVSIAKYVNAANDSAEVAGFRNAWCEDVQDHAVETGDLVSMIIDADNDPHVLVIVRKHSPGINQCALPGGFKEASETRKQVCMRECQEETAFVSTNMKTEFYDLDTITSMTNDPRPRMSRHGTISHGLLRVDTVMLPNCGN